MKTLLILRHAKAERDARGGDIDRRLTLRGKRDAAAIGAVMKSIALRPDQVITSTAKRAAQTAKRVARATGASSPRPLPALYEADRESLLQLVANLSDDVACVLIVGHNPALEDLTNALVSESARVEHLPTAGLAHLEFGVSRWGDVRPGTAQLRGVHVGHG
jgi:phosphohistidine phosphatase